MGRDLLDLMLPCSRPDPFEPCFCSALSACAHGSPLLHNSTASSRSSGLPADLQNSFLGELEAISRGVDPDGFPPESQCDHCRRAAPDKGIEHGSASRTCRSDWQLNQRLGKYGIGTLRIDGVLDLDGPDICRHTAPRTLHDPIRPQNRWR